MVALLLNISMPSPRSLSVSKERAAPPTRHSQHLLGPCLPASQPVASLLHSLQHQRHNYSKWRGVSMRDLWNHFDPVAY
jgi:hypothetical protein